jgi:hypothetical protein
VVAYERIKMQDNLSYPCQQLYNLLIVGIYREQLELFLSTSKIEEIETDLIKYVISLENELSGKLNESE